MPLITPRRHRVTTVQHICRLQEPNRDALVRDARFIGDTVDAVFYQRIVTTIAKDREFVASRAEQPAEVAPKPNGRDHTCTARAHAEVARHENAMRPFRRPIAYLIQDPDVPEIMINRSRRIFLERQGLIEAVDSIEVDERRLKVAVKNIADAHRIIVSEVLGGEAYNLVQAVNTGHSGVWCTIHPNSAEQALARLTWCVLQSTIRDSERPW